MAEITIEHINITVSDIARTSAMLCDLFDWKVRWRGQKGGSIHGGTSWHVGGENSYLAIYSQDGKDEVGNPYTRPGGLNHIGVEVADLDGVEKRVKGMGLEPYSHADYEPGRRFYFRDHDGIEYEVVSYR